MLHARLNGYLTYFERLATQPTNHWNGFYMSQHEGMNFALRYQLSFACYALGALALHPIASRAEQQRARSAMAALIDRMLQRRVWAYWAARADQRNTDIDPINEANVQYSGALSMMLGAYRVAGGDTRYDEPFTLVWSPADRFHYTHTSVVDTIANQMQRNRHHGVECEPGRINVSTMNHALWGNLLHDRIFHTTYAITHDLWFEYVVKHLVQRGLRLMGRTIFQAAIPAGSGLVPRLAIPLPMPGRWPVWWRWLLIWRVNLRRALSKRLCICRPTRTARWCMCQ
ncbi:MAG: hypothetical protein HC876_02475 [Chloroflexaceae bacterium]|nr:hypothetical protein [Chloroflexaceae bacterium]